MVASLHVRRSFGTKLQLIEIKSNSGELLQSVQFEDQPDQGDPRPTLALVGWSWDGRSVYYFQAYSYDGAVTLWSGFDLRAIEVATGRTAILVPTRGLMAFRFSPDKTMLAYVQDEDSPRVLYIRDLENRNPSELQHRHIAIQRGPVHSGGCNSMVEIRKSALVAKCKERRPGNHGYV